MSRNILILVLALACTSSAAGARTWRVEQDGSGDWFSIQAGVEAAADGDTILIGPGHYSDLHPAPVSDAVAYWNDAKGLVFIGEDVDEVIVGPEEFVPSSEGTYGFNYAGGSNQHFDGITLVNLDFAISSTGSGIWVTNCKTYECIGGAIVNDAQEGVISNCVFSLTEFNSLATGVGLRGTQNIVIDNCEFYNMEVYLEGTPTSTIRYCLFEHTNWTAAVVYFGAGGVFEFNESNSYVFAADGGSVSVFDNVFLQGPMTEYCLWVSGRFPTVEVSGNIFEGGSYSTIYLTSYASISGSGNHILRGTSEYSVVLRGYSGAYSSTVDLRNNYWGASDPDSIAAMIYDGNDDPEIQQTVQFEPFSSVPLPSEKPSLGGFKAMFR